MQLQQLIISLFFLLLGTSCQNNRSERKIVEVKGGSISEIIKHPLEADGTLDTINVAKLHFEEWVFDFGKVEEGDYVNHDFPFTNTGTVPLIISDARSTCGCTVPEWPQDFIQPGQQDVISVQFNTKGKPEYQEKTITIKANTYPNATKIIIRGYVIPKDLKTENEG